jgi:hypothetical protein
VVVICGNNDAQFRKLGSHAPRHGKKVARIEGNGNGLSCGLVQACAGSKALADDEHIP